MLIATAGHVDHGKTSLVKALTGVDTDRLPEEKKRGLTIDLGFAYQTTPQGQQLGFVDVPGHERFIRNMVAGVPAIDVVLLVVAADDGVMPQTQEHLAIVSLLGVNQAVVAITKTDLVEPARINQVITEVTVLLALHGFNDSAFFPLSTKTGTGVEPLAEYLQTLAKTLTRDTSSGYFRLAIDRCFSVTGAGVVVTGAIFSGRVQTGDGLQLLPSQKPVRVRGLQWQNQAADSAKAGDRCALNIVGAGVTTAAIERGDWVVSPGLDLLSTRFDVKLRLLRDEQQPLKHWTAAQVHAGASATTGRVALLEGKALAAGQTMLAQLILEQPVSLVYGDHFVLRDQSAQRTLGGGYVIDPFGLQRGRSKPARVQLLEAIDTDDPQQALTALLTHAAQGVDLATFANSRNLTPAASETLFKRCAMMQLNQGGNVFALAINRWHVLRENIVNALHAWHQQQADVIGPKLQQLRQVCVSNETTTVFAAAVDWLIRHKEIVREGLFLRLPDHRVQLTAADQQLFEQVQVYLKPDELKPPALKDLAALTQLDRNDLGAFLLRATRSGLLVQISATRFFHPTAVESLTQVCQQLCQQTEDQQFVVRDFCNAAGLGRNAAIEVLEYFDNIGFTRRFKNNRCLNPNRVRH